MGGSSTRFVRAAYAIVAVAASFCATYALCRYARAQPGPAVLSAILAIGLARRASAPDRRHVLTAPLSIACAALLASGVGWLLLSRPVFGAIAFVAGMSLSIYLRNFGERATRIGAMIALPLVAILIAPARADAPGGPLVDLVLVIAAGVVALVCVIIVQWCARRFGMPDPAKRPAVERPPKAAGARAAFLTPTTRLALQMAVALSAAFALGFLVFPGHWGWAVLTAFIVSSGARGRGDAAYKGILRLAGALCGTVGAVLVTHLWLPSGPPEAVAIFAILYFAIALRDVNYAYWACGMTLVLALLAHPDGATGFAFLALRLEAILAGALCAVAAAWFVFPIRTEAVIRRRLADALLALDDLAAHAIAPGDIRSGKLAAFEHRLADLDDVAPPVRLHRSVFARTDASAHPATWIDLTRGLREQARTFEGPRAADERVRVKIRKAIGASRRAIGDHGKPDTPAGALTIGGALRRLHETFRATDVQ